MVASWACEVTEIHKNTIEASSLLCEDYSDLTSPNSNNILDINKAESIVFDTF